jgi:hypothetical protein
LRKILATHFIHRYHAAEHCLKRIFLAKLQSSKAKKDKCDNPQINSGQVEKISKSTTEAGRVVIMLEENIDFKTSLEAYKQHLRKSAQSAGDKTSHHFLQSGYFSQRHKV